MKQSIRKLIILIVALSMNLSLISPMVYAGMIETQSVLSQDARVDILNKATRLLLEQDVADVMQSMGVNQTQVLQRLSRLSDAELQALSDQIDNAPAGAGLVEVVGIVFIVLLILEIVGVTDIFKKL